MIRAVVFDAVGTVIRPTVPVAELYRESLAAHCDVRLPAAQIAHTIQESLRARSQGDCLRTDEAIELEFWRQLVFGLCGSHPAREACFADLYSRFADPAHWQCFDDVAACLDSVRSSGRQLAIASNFDRRLHPLLDGLSDVSAVDRRFVSSEVGYRKPSEFFFRHVCQQLGHPSGDVLFVGDDPINDALGADQAGCPSAWVGRDGSRSAALPASTLRLASLHELKDQLDARGGVHHE